MFFEYGFIILVKVMCDSVVEFVVEDEKDKENKKEDEEEKEGEIVEKKVEIKEKCKFGKSKGFGFVCFSNFDDVIKVVIEMN